MAVKIKAANRAGLDGFKNPRINVMTFQALECPIFKAFIGRRHAHYFICAEHFGQDGIR
jgi:hypothetical protein